MSVNEILAEIERLSPNELQIIQEKLDLRLQDDLGETPELLAAVDEGLRSLNEEATITLQELRERMKSWNFESP